MISAGVSTPASQTLQHGTSGDPSVDVREEGLVSTVFSVVVGCRICHGGRFFVHNVAVQLERVQLDAPIVLSLLVKWLATSNKLLSSVAWMNLSCRMWESSTIRHSRWPY